MVVRTRFLCGRVFVRRGKDWEGWADICLNTREGEGSLVRFVGDFSESFVSGRMPRKVAFFGATGGCANACLAYTLLNGHSATALVRSPEKLKELLSKREVPDDVCAERLEIVKGDVKDVEAVEKALYFRGGAVDTVISGIGGVPAPQLNPFKPLTMTDPTIVGDATQTILTAIEKSNNTALLVVLSANGVLDDGPRDYPLALTPLYRWMLRGVFDDKRQTEALVQESPPAGGCLVVRPSVLGDGPSQGVEKLRQGWTNEPVVGWSISRDDVGLWIFEHVIGAADSEREKYKGQGVQITY